MVIDALGLYLRYIGVIQTRFGPELGLDVVTGSIEASDIDTVARFVCPRNHRVWEYLGD